MPEGHTLAKIAKDHGKLLTGQQIGVSSPQGPFAADAARVDGATLERLESYGKHLFYHWSTGEIGHVHLGLFGKFTVHTGDERPEPRGAVRMRLESDAATIDLAGPTACSIDDPSIRKGILARLGPDPIKPRQNPQRMYDKIAKSSRGIGDLLMDQSVVAGVGNVYRAEALFVCGIHPLRPGKECDPRRGRSTVGDDHRDAAPRREGRTHPHRVTRGVRGASWQANPAQRGDVRLQARHVPALRDRDPAARHRQPNQLPLPHLPAPLSQRTSNQTPVCAVPM